jgi:ATP-dependent protease ClpP protease subunit
MLHYPATILLYGNIDEKMSYFFTREMQRFARHKNVLIRINSYGGELLPALGIINVLKQHRGNIITLVDGFAASSASLIAASGDARFMFKTSFHLVHPVVNDCPINAPTFNSIIKTIYNGIDLPEEKWMPASECFEYRLCDKII